MTVGISANMPVAGYYRMRLRHGGVPAAIRLWNGPPHDPETGEVMDRSWRWQATANGKLIDLERVWPQCAADPIDKEEAEYLTGLQVWGEEHAPRSPQADPLRKVNFLTAPMPF